MLEHKRNTLDPAEGSMKIASCHSHLGGFEFLKIHKPALWSEIEGILQSAKVHENAPVNIGAAVTNAFRQNGWHAARRDNVKTETAHLHKERVGFVAYLGARGIGPYDLFAEQMASYVGDVIDVGVEILPMKKLQAQMLVDLAYYEGELGNLVREGRGAPAVPLVLIGLAP